MMNRRHFVRSTVAAAVATALPWSRLYALDQEASQAAAGISAVKLDGSATVIEQAALKDLKARLRGPLMLSGDAGYDQARRVLNRVNRPASGADRAADRSRGRPERGEFRARARAAGRGQVRRAQPGRQVHLR